MISEGSCDSEDWRNDSEWIYDHIFFSSNIYYGSPINNLFILLFCLDVSEKIHFCSLFKIFNSFEWMI